MLSISTWCVFDKEFARLLTTLATPPFKVISISIIKIFNLISKKLKNRI